MTNPFKLNNLVDRRIAKSALGLSLTTLVLALFSVASFAEEWVPVYEEPKHRLVFENDQAFILNVNIPPGYTSLYHQHKIDLLYVHIVGSRVWAQPLGGNRREVDVKAGDLRFSSDNHSLPQIHRVGNLGSTPFHLIGVGIKSNVSKNIEPLEGDTSGMEMTMEKTHARVYRIVLEPGEKTGVHQHNLPFTQVHVSAAKYFSTSGKIISAEPGEFLWQESAKSHQFENAGSEAIEIVELQWR
jgi:mannose-6-phosphate isomerase-like protein (cupin superfamily)